MIWLVGAGVCGAVIVLVLWVGWQQVADDVETYGSSRRYLHDDKGPRIGKP